MRGMLNSKLFVLTSTGLWLFTVTALSLHAACVSHQKCQSGCTIMASGACTDQTKNDGPCEGSDDPSECDTCQCKSIVLDDGSRECRCVPRSSTS